EPAAREISTASATTPAVNSPGHWTRASAMVSFSRRMARCSPIPSSTSHSAKGKPSALEQGPRFEQRQADNAGMAARNPCDQPFGAALDRVAASLAVPLSAGDVGAYLSFGERLEAHLGLAQPLAQHAI